MSLVDTFYPSKTTNNRTSNSGGTSATSNTSRNTNNLTSTFFPSKAKTQVVSSPKTNVVGSFFKKVGESITKSDVKAKVSNPVSVQKQTQPGIDLGLDFDFGTQQTTSAKVTTPKVVKTKLPSGNTVSVSPPTQNKQEDIGSFDLGTKETTSASISEGTKKKISDFYSPEAMSERRKNIQEEVISKSRDIKPGYKEPGVFGSIIESIKESTVGMVSGFGATIEMIGNFNQLISVTKAGQKIQKEAEKVLASNPEWREEEGAKWSAKKVARLVAGSAPFLIATIGATFVAGLPGGAVVAFSMEAGSPYKEALEAGKSNEDATKYGVTVGLVNAILEQIFPSKLFDKKKIAKESIEQISKSISKDILKKAKDFAVKFTKNGTLEGSTEILQELWANVIATNYDENRNLWDNLLESFVGGFGSGGIASVTIDPGEYTPQEVLDKVVNSPIQDTEEGKILIQQALEAKVAGNNVVIEEEAPKFTKIDLTEPEVKQPETTTKVETKQVEKPTAKTKNVAGGGLVDTPTTRLLSVSGAEIEVPVANAVDATNGEGSASSGFHSAFTKDYIGIDPSWAIVYEKPVSQKLIQSAESSGLKILKREAPKGSGQILTYVYLDNVGENQANKATEVFDKFAETYNQYSSQGVKVPTKITTPEVKIATKLPTIEKSTKELQDTYSTTKAKDKEAMGNAWYETMMEVEVAEPGQRLFDEDGEFSGSISSTFPSFVPEELRSTDLFNSVMDGLKDPDNIVYPPNSQPKKQALYDAILDEIDSRAGTDTSIIRQNIRSANEKAKAKEKPKKAVSRSPKRSQVTKKTVIVTDKAFENYIDSKGVKLRVNDASSELMVSPTYKITSKFLENIDVRGKTTAGYEYLFNLSKSTALPLKQVEREIIQRVLDRNFKGEKKINMEEFRRLVVGEMMALDVIETKTYSSYGSDNLGMDGDYLDTKTYILNSPYYHGNTGHFPTDFGRLMALDQIEIKEIPVQPQNPRAKFAVVSKGVILTEQNIEANVFTLTNTKKEAQDWIKEHTDENKDVVLQRTKGLFSHFRTFDVERQHIETSEGLETQNGKISHIAEIQSDAFQHPERINKRKDLEDRIENKKMSLVSPVNKGMEASLRADIESEISNLEGRLREIGEPTKEEKQFLDYKNIWHERSVREAINIKAKEGADIIRFPLPRTVAGIEGFISGEEGDTMPYEIVSASDETNLTFGDTIDYGGEEMTVVKEDGNEIVVAPSDKVRNFLHSDYMEEDIQGRWDDRVVYEFGQLEEDFGTIDTAEKAQKVIDSTDALNRLSLFSSIETNIKDRKTRYEDHNGRKMNLDIIKNGEESLKNYEKLTKLIKGGIVKKEKFTVNELVDGEVLPGSFDSSNIHKLELKYDLPWSYWNYIQDAMKYGRATTPSEISKKVLDNIEAPIENNTREIKLAKENILEYKNQLNRDLEEIRARKAPLSSELKGIPKKLIDRVKDNVWGYSLDYEVEQVLDIMSNAGPEETFSLDDFEQDWKNKAGENYEADYEGMYGSHNVFYEEINSYDQRVWIVEEGGNPETFMQPGEYDAPPNIDDFNITNFEGNQRTVLEFYNKQINPYLEKIRKDNIKQIVDDNGWEWLETKVTPEDLKPPTAFRLKDDLAKVGIKITNDQEQDILKLNKRIFGDTNVKVVGQIIANKDALGSYQEQIIQILDRQVDPTDTFYHEAVHKYLDVFTERSEYINILKEAQQKYQLADLGAVEEKLAENFIRYAKSRKGVTGKIKVYFDKIIFRIKKFLGNQVSIDKLYADIISGKAREKVGVARQQIPVGEGREKVSRLEARIKNALGKVTPYEIETLGLSTYNEINKKENIALASKYVVDNPGEAMQVLRGEVDAPPGILRNAIFVALNNLGQSDAVLARQIATLQATRLGQEISILTEIDKDSAVSKMTEVANERARIVEKRMKKSSEKLITEEVAKIKKSAKTISKYDWQTFIQSIEC